MPPTEEDLAWFRSTFHPVPRPRLPDDCIDYRLYIFDERVSSENDSEHRQRLCQVQEHASELRKKWLNDYIWQRQDFRLEWGKEDGMTILKGQTEYGDSAEDEWVIVWLLRELTKRFPELWVKVNDHDGEFLLIEAAGALPDWLEPEVADNRVWINHGSLCILKPHYSQPGKKIKGRLSLTTARTVALQQPSHVMRSSMIEAEAFHRLRNYPRQIAENMHNTIVRMPRKIAYLLHQKAAYIAPAIEAFYLRDPISLRPLKGRSDKSLLIGTDDIVTFSTRMPRIGFAQLKSQEFETPALWVSKLSAADQGKEYQQAQIGMKIACGFEMLLADPQSQDKAVVREIKMLLENLETGDSTLPSDLEISRWSLQQDDESWLDISFDDLEGELNKKDGLSGEKGGEFGNKATQENLQRIVAQFEAFLNDENSGPDASGMFGEDSECSEDADSEVDIEGDGEDEDASFNEDTFTKMMHEMMGLGNRATSDGQAAPRSSNHVYATKTGKVEDFSSEDESLDATDMRKEIKQMKAELREHNALDLGPLSLRPKSPNTFPDNQKMPRNGNVHEDGRRHSADLKDANVNVAMNLLESYRSQAGQPGPGGNIMGLMQIGTAKDKQKQKPDQ